MWRNLMAIVLVWGPALAAQAEDVTVSTYYPSPRGVYKELRVANNAELASQGGNVLIGAAPPVAKLGVDGSANISGNMTIQGTIRIEGGGPGTKKTLVSNAAGDAAWDYGYAVYSP